MDPNQMQARIKTLEGDNKKLGDEKKDIAKKAMDMKTTLEKQVQDVQAEAKRLLDENTELNKKLETAGDNSESAKIIDEQNVELGNLKKVIEKGTEENARLEGELRRVNQVLKSGGKMVPGSTAKGGPKAPPNLKLMNPAQLKNYKEKRAKK